MKIVNYINMQKAAYFTLSYSTNLKEVGKVDQIRDLTIPVDQKIIEQYQGQITNTWTEDVPDFSLFKLENRAKLTDILSAEMFLKTPEALIISNKVKNILEQFRTENFRFYNATVTDAKGNKHAFNVLGLDLVPEIIDFEASKFMITDIGGKINMEPIQIFSSKDLSEKKKIHRYIKYISIVLKKPWDVVRIPGFYEILISERLKLVLEEAKITGAVFGVPKFEIYV